MMKRGITYGKYDDTRGGYGRRGGRINGSRREDTEKNYEKAVNGDKFKNFKRDLIAQKEIVVFKSGKPIIVDKSSEISREVNPNAKKKFDKFHCGECVVTATLINEYCTTRGQSNFLKIIEVITDHKHTPIKVVKAGFKAIDMYFHSVDKANYLLNDTKVNVKIKCYIMNRNIYSRGVISNWDGNIKRLGEAIDNKTNIISIERMLKRKFNNSDKKLIICNTNNFIITFKGRTLPDNISLYDGLVKIRVRAYIPEVKQCYNCYRFGHTKAVCKNKSKVCVVCSEDFHGYCDRQEKCINCGGKHKANDRKCEQLYLLNKQSLKISAERHVSIHEAKNIIKDNIKTGSIHVWFKPDMA